MREGGLRGGVRRQPRRRAPPETRVRTPRVELYPCRTAMVSRSSPSRTTSAAATVMRRRRTYSDSGMPASEENIRRKWYSVVPSVLANSLTSICSVRCFSTRSTSRLSAEITRPPFDINPGRAHLVRALPRRSDPITAPVPGPVAAITHAPAADRASCAHAASRVAHAGIVRPGREVGPRVVLVDSV